MNSRHVNALIISFIFIITCSCKNENKTKQIGTETDLAEEVIKNPSGVIDVVTRSMEFQSVDKIPSGWNTFRYQNLSNETHFLVIEKYPEGKNADSTKAQVFPVFDKGMTLINEGNVAEGFEAFNSLPAWFFEVGFYGGVGLVSPKSEAETTVKLAPGNYLIECYVKMSNGKFHSVMGMYKEIQVTNEISEISEPEPTINVEISSENGIVFNDSIPAGNHIFGVTYKDQKLHEHFLGHDVNLVRLDESANLEALDAWMNWADPKGLISPTPKGFTFLGGVQEMPAGYTGYFTADLTPGKYVLISEVPASASKKMLQVFEVK